MKATLCLAAFFGITTFALADDATTEYVADPIVITVEVDNWESDPIYQLPTSAPTKLVENRVKLTQAFDAYTTAQMSLKQLIENLSFEPTKEQMQAVDIARDQIELTLANLVALEVDFVQEKQLFQADAEEYAKVNSLPEALAKN